MKIPQPTLAPRLTLGRAIRGYAVAVPTASLAILAALYLSDRTRPGAQPEAWSNLGADGGVALEILPFVLILVAIGALPGFALVAAAARLFSWTGWLPFILGGGVAGGLALTGLTLLVDAKPSMPEGRTLLGFATAGAFGGIAFWWAAFRTRATRPPTSDPEPSV